MSLMFQRPNLKNLSCGAAQIWLVLLKIVFNDLRFKPALNLNWFLADLRHGSNSLNLETNLLDNRKVGLKNGFIFYLFRYYTNLNLHTLQFDNLSTKVKTTQNCMVNSFRGT